MSELQSQQVSIGTFVGGVQIAGDPITEIKVHGYEHRPSWPVMTTDINWQMICAFIIAASDVEKATRDFLDIASDVSKSVGYFCNTTMIAEPRYGKVACTLEVTRTVRDLQDGARVIMFPHGDVHLCRQLGDEIGVALARGLSARGYKNLNTRKAA